MYVDFGFNSLHSSAFVDLSRRKQRKVKERVEESIDRVAARLEGHIELPLRTKVKFIDSDEVDACVAGMTLKINTSTLRYALKRSRVFDGLIGHETSHLSDFRTGNFTRQGLP